MKTYTRVKSFIDGIADCFANCELRRIFASHARTFAHSIFGRTHARRTHVCVLPKVQSHTHSHVLQFSISLKIFFGVEVFPNAFRDFDGKI